MKRRAIPLLGSIMWALTHSLISLLVRTTCLFTDGSGHGRDGSVQPPSSHPHPNPQQITDKDEDDDPDSEPAIQENIRPYSERRAFWEQVASSGSAETPTEPLVSPMQGKQIITVLPQIRSGDAPIPIPRHVSHAESVDSEVEYLARHGRNVGMENDGFENEEFSSKPKMPTRMHSVEGYGETPPPVAVRKALYERSISLPCTEVQENTKRKRQFEDHLKKELVADKLMQQLEEEAVPEHKALPRGVVSDDTLESIKSDESTETQSAKGVSVKALTSVFESSPSHEDLRETAEAIVRDTVCHAAAIVHKAEEHVILEPQEQVTEWQSDDVHNRLNEGQQRRHQNIFDDEKTTTELRRESLARTHEITCSKLAEVMQYKGDSVSKPSDSLEVHVDKSETEETEKSRDLDDDIRELEVSRRAESRVSSAGSKGARGRDHQSQSSSEDTQCESDVTPEDHPDHTGSHSLYQPQQHVQDIVWEVGVQEQVDPLPDEFVQDILVPSGQIILENGDLHGNLPVRLEDTVHATGQITEEEARKVAEELVQDIEQEVCKRQMEPPIIDTIRQLAEEKKLEDREIELMQSLLAKKQRDQGHLFSRTDTTTSSMEITDEDLRSSGVEIDLSPTESQSGLYQSMDPRARQEDEKPEALRSEDIDISDLKPDPIQLDDTPNDRMHKNFSIIEESDECDTRSDNSEVKGDQVKTLKTKRDCEDEIRRSIETVNEELDEEIVIRDVPFSNVPAGNIAQTIEEEDTEYAYDASVGVCRPQGSPTGSTTSSGGKRTPPPKPERKSRSPPETGLRFEKSFDRVVENMAVRAGSVDSQKSSSQDDRSPLSSGETGKGEVPDVSGVTRRHHARPDGESSSSGEKSGGLYPDRRSGADFDPYSSSSESHYHSTEQTYSRPCSSDVEGLLAVTTGSSEYESAVASTRSVTSTDYQTAVSSLSSRESMKSLDSESSGNLASIEVSSEASETLVPSTTEFDDMDDSINMALEDELERRTYEQSDKSFQDLAAQQKRIPREISDDDADDTRDQIETDEEDDIPHIMKRSHEMTFYPEPKTLPSGRSESSMDVPDDKLASSMDGDTGSVLSMSISSASETVAIKTVIELSRTDSEKMDASGTSEQLTVSGTSQEMSFSFETKESDDLSVLPLSTKTIGSGTSTPTHQRDGTVSSVTITTSLVAEDGVQSASTQMTSESSMSPPHDVPRRSHRRNESTSNFSSFRPTKPGSEVPVGISKKESIAPESSEGDAYYHDEARSPIDSEGSEKKSNEHLEESYQTEADQAFHREAREARCLSDEVEPELEQLDGSRPQSQVSKSDSESGHRAISSGFSDERADSELAEVLRQGSSDTACEDLIERPFTPEPAEEIQIRPDVEFSSEALASVSDLEIEYGQAQAYSRTVEYASHVSPLKDKPCVAWDHSSDHEDEMAEAEAAFHMVPHHSPHHHAMPESILEDDDGEKSELEAREAALKEQQRKREEHMRSISPANIPNITVTEHMQPIVDKNYQYPDLEKDMDQQEVESSFSKGGASNTTEARADTNQGKEYVLDDTFTSQSESICLQKSTCEGNSKQKEIDSVLDSPISESFEMLEKPDFTDDRHDAADEFVIVEEVGREAHENDGEGQGIRIRSANIHIRKRDSPSDEEEEFVAQSPPPPMTRKMDVKYYGEGGVEANEDDPFGFESSHEQSETYDEAAAMGQHIEAEEDFEAGKKWIEMQFGVEDAATVSTPYNYEMDFERGPLEDIKEEDEMGTSSKIGSLGSQKGSAGSGSVKESLSSTPEYDVLAGKKYFTRSGDHDDVSMSSLQEFESLEHQIALDAAHKRMIGSQDSLNGVPKKRMPGDDISLASLQEFEKMERVCVEAERIEIRARVEEALLSEIDEGHESQVSDSDETISCAPMKTTGDSDSDDYDKRMFEIDEIIRQAQSNVERFDTPGRRSGGPESFGRGDSFEEVARVPDLDFDTPASLITSTDSLELRNRHSDSMVTSADSLEVKVSPHMGTSADSIELQYQLRSQQKPDVMTDSIELPTEQSNMITSSDSLELETTLERGAEDEESSLAGRGSLRSGTGSLQDRSSSSGRDGDLSSSSALGACGGARIDPAMLGSTDSLEPSSSTATHATYQYETDSNMSSSFTSGGSNTMVSSTETLEASASLPPEGVWFEEAYGTEHYSPSDYSVDTQHADDHSGAHLGRAVQRRVVVRGDLKRTDLSGLELDDYLPRHGMTETDFTNILASSSSLSEIPGPGAVVATTQQRLTTSHLTGSESC